MKLVYAHVDASSPERDPFSLQTKALFSARVAAQFDFPARPHNAVPGQIKGSMQGSDDLTGGPGGSRCLRDCPIRRDMTARHGPNSLYNTVTHAAWHGQICYLICSLSPILRDVRGSISRFMCSGHLASREVASKWFQGAEACRD